MNFSNLVSPLFGRVDCAVIMVFSIATLAFMSNEPVNKFPILIWTISRDLFAISDWVEGGRKLGAPV